MITPKPAWIKSSLSFALSNCIEMAALPDGNVAMRNSRFPDGPSLIFTRAEIEAFLAGAKNGEFDDLAGPAEVPDALDLSAGFKPDWCIAPSALLTALMTEQRLTRGMLAARCGRGEADIKAALIIGDVMDRRPLLDSHAGMLARGTGTPASFWLNAERTYRDGLAAGLTDTTPRPRNCRFEYCTAPAGECEHPE